MPVVIPDPGIPDPGDPPADLAYARSIWADARDISDEVLGDLLDTAWSACAEYAPAEQVARYASDPGAFPGGILVRWRHANVLHARDLWRAAARDGDVVSFDAYAMRVRPVSDVVRALLRPRRGVPQVG
jgi:hypothetical protein